jgi:ABC-type sugar transport system substrate-binding protein
MNVIKHYPAIKVLGNQEAMTIELGVDVMSNMLQAHDDIDAVWAVNDPAGLGALRAIQASGRSKDVFIVAIDGDPEAVKAIRDGDTYALTVAQFPVELSNHAVDAAVAAIEGTAPLNNVEIIGSDLRMPIFYTPVFAITKDNVGNYDGWHQPAPGFALPTWWK